MVWGISLSLSVSLCLSLSLSVSLCLSLSLPLFFSLSSLSLPSLSLSLSLPVSLYLPTLPSCLCMAGLLAAPAGLGRSCPVTGLGANGHGNAKGNFWNLFVWARVKCSLFARKVSLMRGHSVVLKPCHLVGSRRVCSRRRRCLHQRSLSSSFV